MISLPEHSAELTLPNTLTGRRCATFFAATDFPASNDMPAQGQGTVPRMFYNLGQLFGDNCKTDLIHRSLSMDHKHRRQFLERRPAMDHRAENYEEQQIKE